MVDLQVPQAGMNAFQKPILPLRELLLSQAVKEYVTHGLLAIFSDIGLTDETRERIVDTVIEETLQTDDLLVYERRMHRFLEENSVFEGLSKKTAGRAERMVEVVLPWLVSGSVLDLGCGPGGVGRKCAEHGYKVMLADVYESSAIAKLGLPFTRITQNAGLPFKEASFENILIFAMLHHVEDPLRMISEVKRLLPAGGRLHLIETVYGLNSSELSEQASLLDRGFAALDLEEQRVATMFFDYFGNHVTWYYTENPEKYVPVPFNFNIPSFWREQFGQAGFRCLQSRPWQIDPASGVFHYLLTFER